MKRITLATALIAAVTAWTVSAETPEEKGLALAKKSDAANSGFAGEKSEMELVLINAHGDRITRKMRTRVKEVSDDGDKSLTEFLWPADVKGTRMLTWTHRKGDDDQWLYLPSIKRVKRISSSDRSGSFMGSEFAYEDLGSQEVEKYSFKYLRDETLGGRPQHVLERVPAGKSGYSKQILWMDQEHLNPSRLEYYDRKGELLKTAEFKGYKKIGKHWRADSIHMMNHQTRKQSVITWTNRELGAKVSDSEFQSSRLED